MAVERVELFKQKITIINSTVFNKLVVLLTLIFIPASSADNANHPSTELTCRVGTEIIQVTSIQQCDRAEHRRWSDQLEDTELKANVPLINLEIAEAIKFGFNYRYKVVRDKVSNIFTRVDRYVLPYGLKPGEVLDNTSVFIEMKKQNEIIFAQQFLDGDKARDIQSGYLPRKLPTDATKALDLNPGDYVQFNAQMNLVTSLSQLIPMPNGIINGRTDISFLLRGEFQIHFYRLNDSMIRLKLVGLNRDQFSSNLSVGIQGHLDILGIKSFDKKIVKALSLDAYLKVSRTIAEESLFVVDYTLNLSSPQVAKAYNKIFNATKELKSFELSDPLKDQESVKQLMISNAQPLEQIAIKQMGLTELSDRTAIRNFKGSNASDSKANQFRFGFLAVKKQGNEVFRNNFLTSVRNDGSEKRDYYLYPSWTKKIETDRGIFTRLLGIGESLDEELTQTSNAIFKANSNGEPTEFINIGFTFDYRDRQMRRDELEFIIQKLATLTPGKKLKQELKRSLTENQWLTENPIENVWIRMEYLFHNKALELLENARFGKNSQLLSNKSLLKHEFLNFVNSIGLLEREYSKQKYRYNSAKYTRVVNGVPVGKFKALEEIGNKFGRFKTIVNQLSIALDKEQDNKARLAAFSKLRESKYFRQIGTSFLVSLLSRIATQDEIDSLYYLKFKLRANDRNTISAELGKNSQRELYSVIRYIEDLLNDDSENIQSWHRVHEMFGNSQVILGE